MGKEFSKDFSLLLCSTQTQDNFKKNKRDLGCSFIDPNHIQETLLIVIILIHEGKYLGKYEALKVFQGFSQFKKSFSSVYI